MAEGDSSRKRPRKTSYQTSSDRILLKMFGQDGKLMTFDVKRKKPLKNLLLKYCECKKLEYSAVNFIYLGHRVLVRSTPEEIGMKDGDVIEVMVHVDGGGDVEDIYQM